MEGKSLAESALTPFRFLNSNFWSSYKNQASQSIETLLTKEGGCTVEELLNDDDVIQELKNNNEKLIAL